MTITLSSVYGGFLGVIIFFNFLFLIKGSVEAWEEIFNPIQIYYTYNINWFGCILLTLVLNTLFIIPAICIGFISYVPLDGGNE